MNITFIGICGKGRNLFNDIMKKTILLSFLIFIGAHLFAGQSLPIVKVGETYPSESAYVFGSGEQLSGQQFQTDGILTYKGYQYTVYYNATRNVCISRRKMPVGAWEEVALPYKNSANDAHNVIVMGICPNDGTIHLSYDHHNDDLHYCYSIAGSANEPENMPWEASSFSATTNVMDKEVPNVTYPRFIPKPDGNLLFECRFRWSGYGDSYLREYDAATKKWTLIGRYVQGEDIQPDACAYINGMTYDKSGKLHVTWCWRDDFGGGSNHDFYYAYSEDHGRSWKNDKGTATATTDIMEPVYDSETGNCLGQTKKDFMVEEIGYNRGYINQETQDVDSKGRIFAVNSHIPDGEGTDSNWNNSRTKARLHLRFLKEDKSWVKRLITYDGNSINSKARVHLAIDSYDNAYVVANGAGVFMGSPDDEYANWKKISSDGETGYYSEPLVDRRLLKENGVLSFVYLSADRKIAVFDYLVRNPNQPDGTGLLAEYFSDDNFSTLISSETVATPDRSNVPTHTKSIRWSGTFETLLGEEYTLHVNAAGKTNIYINDQLAKIIGENGGDESFRYRLIASHKNNIVIESNTSSPVSLSWSGENTEKQIIPVTSLYPVKANDKPGNITPPALNGKIELEDKLLTEKIAVKTNEKSVFSIAPFDPPLEYSLEVKAKVNAAEGRGMDIEARSKAGKGFRVSLDPTSINWTAPLTASEQIAAVDNTTEQVYRFAVKDDKVHIYRDIEYIGTRNIDYIGSIGEDDTETAPEGLYGNEIIGEWAGASLAGEGKPTDYGWSSSASPNWVDANVNASGAVRYMDINTSTDPGHIYNGDLYTGRLLILRWDSGLSGSAFFYPVRLDADTSYEFSMISEHWNNGAIGAPITVGISSTNTINGVYDSSSFATVAKNTLQENKFAFTSKDAGNYYLVFTGETNTMYAIGELSLKSHVYENGLQIGKNYNGGTADFEIIYVTYEEGAYAAGEGTVSIEDTPVSEKDVEIYVSGNRLNIESNSVMKEVSVFTVLGQVCDHSRLSGNSYSVELPKGIYIVKIRTIEKETATKIIVK